jgi:N12 class adenine-specific DNA methylase
MQDGYEQAVIETLENAFGELDEKNTLPDALMCAVMNAVEDNFSDYLPDLLSNSGGSLLAEKDNLTIEAIFKSLLKSSVVCMALTRCGFNPNAYLADDYFQGIDLFNTLDTISHLGAAASDISEMLLRQIEATVKDLHKTAEKLRRTFEKKHPEAHNEDRIHDERSDERGTDILAAGRLPASRPDTAGAGNAAYRQVWDVAQNLSQEQSERDLRQPDAVGQSEQPSDGDRPDSAGERRTHDGGYGTFSRRDGGAESTRPDEMDGADEQHQAPSRRNGTGGAGIQLTLLLTEEQQKQAIEQAEDKKSSAFSIPQAEIDYALCKGTSFQDGKLRVFLYYREARHTSKEIADFLKHEFGIGGGTHYFSDGTNGNVWHDSKGFAISRNGGFSTNPDLRLTWNQVAKRIGELIATDRYLNGKEKEQLPAFRQQMDERRQQFAEQAYARKILSQMPTTSAEEQPDANAVYVLSLGCTVYIGADEYEVFSFDGNRVELRDMRFPLLTKTLARRDFDRIIRETPLNDHLISKDTSEQAARVTIQADDPNAPEWVQATGDITVTREGDTFTIDSADNTGKKAYVEFDIELPDAQTEQMKPQPAEKELVVGIELSIDGRRFVIDGIDAGRDTVSLRDVTFVDATGFPIFRSENMAFVRRALEQQAPIPADEPLRPVWEKTDGGEVSRVRIDLIPGRQTVPHPQQKHSGVYYPGEIVVVEDHIAPPRHDFRITNDNLGVGGQKTKYGYNVAAIRLLKQLEEQKRLATPEEQEILSRYVGWGALPQAFDAENASWTNEYTELKGLLTDEEYESARGSTLNAHYTSPIVIKAIYQCIVDMGFRTGNVLEPACGTGNFFGLVPEVMAGSKLYGIELDSLTGRIAKQLYQNANIAVQGFEKTSLPDSFFDLIIGNVPFGSYGVADKRYDKNHFLIHDYFLAKSLDLVRPGGIIAFITSKGTLDKKNSAVRKYIAQRADLIGAVRLPNNAFTANAGTQVTSDILFLQKRDHPVEVEPDWIHLSQISDGISVNSYFSDHPEMMLGTMARDDMMYGNLSETTCVPFPDADLAQQLHDALANIRAEITEYERDEELEESGTESIPADPDVRNFSFTLVDGQIYYRENSRMNKVEVSITAANRIRGMIGIRDCTRRLIEYQLEGYSDETIRQEQHNLNTLYDRFAKQYGLINSRANNMAFSDDNSYCLLCSLEVIDENGELERKADMFDRRTIRQQTVVTSVDTASEALAVSLAEKARVDMPYMAELTGKVEDDLVKELEGVVFFNPSTKCYETADEYLSGNVRWKLRSLKETNDEKYAANVAALEKVQPVDLTASEIDVRLGATWLPQDVVEQFVFDLLEPSYYAKSKIGVHFSPYTASWNISNKSVDTGNVTAYMTYGTNRINAYRIIEESLNLKDVRIFDTVTGPDGKETRVLNKKETMIAQQKQQAIKDAFRDWIWEDHERRERLTALYNEKFNSTRPREYDGSHIRFVGMNPEVTLRPHQINAVARMIYGGNTLLAHEVGAGKSFEMIAAAMETKRLGLSQKSMMVVPNHLTEQMASEFLQLYPSANILVATKKDFETRNRKKFCGRIATGDYDAVIIGHSQFEKIPMSLERQKATLQEQLDEIVDGIADAKSANAERFTIKQLEKTKKAIKLKLDKLNDQTRKDDLITFEELGVDRLFIDEAQEFKNLFLYTKMRNVAGLAQVEAQKSADLFMKCRYLDQLTEGRGVVFATGTPISNAMTEMYTMQRYLQYLALRRNGLQHFDSWASTFGEQVVSIELAPEGTGYRARTRFARFFNLPELISMFKEVADIQTGDMLKLPVPETEYHNVVIKPSEYQRDMVKRLGERAEKVRNGMVDASVDNMLKITSDGRKLALDQRLTNEMLPDEPDSKINVCVDNIYRIWEQGRESKLTQLVFSDLSTPHFDGKFNVYDDIKSKLIARGVPESEIVFIHSAKTEVQKKELFSNVRKGNVRIMMGSTFKMGAGTNVQSKLVALHHIDVPWRPSDITQREGRIRRQGNKNPKIDIFRYVTENTFDAYSWQTIENKQKFISQIMTSKSPVRSCEDVDETALTYAEVKALATGNPHIIEKVSLEEEVSKLRMLKANHQSQKYTLEDSLIKQFPMEIRCTEERISGYKQDMTLYLQHKSDDFSGMTVYGVTYMEKANAGAALIEACKAQTSPELKDIGSYKGFALLLSFDTFTKTFKLTLKGVLSHAIGLGSDIHGNIQRMDNVLDGLSTRLTDCEHMLADIKRQMEAAKVEAEKPFPQEFELKQKSARLAELDALLNMDKRENEMIDTALDEETDDPSRKAVSYER